MKRRENRCMMFKFQLTTVEVLILFYLACSVAFCALVPHESLDVSAEWEKVAPVELDDVVTMHIALTQSNLDNAEDLLMNVSHPSSLNYGRYYSANEVRDLFAPSEETINAVQEWLAANDVEKGDIRLTPNKASLVSKLPFLKAEKLLKTKYFTFKNTRSGKSAIACDSYYLPSVMQSHIDFILPGVLLVPTRDLHSQHANEEQQIGRRDFEQSQDGGLDLCDTIVSPACIRALYNIPLPNITQPDTRNYLGIYENTQPIYYPDLETFFSSYAPNIPSGTQANIETIDNPTIPPVANTYSRSGLETTLDFDVAWPIVYPQNITMLYPPLARDKQGNIDFFDALLDALDGSYCTKLQTGNRDCGTIKPPNVISISYGGTEMTYPVRYQKRQCQEFLKLGMQGVSVIAASGDSGVEDAQGACLGGENGTIFSPKYQSCPYITLVGGTQAVANQSVEAPGFETAWLSDRAAQLSSSGGFSNVFRMPKYQHAVLSAYFNNHDPGYSHYRTVNENGQSFGQNSPKGIYNRIGRASPDVAAIAKGVIISQEKRKTSYNPSGFFLAGGTSAAAPVWAAAINRINEERLATGKSPVGFINPVLYENTNIMNDITTGHNVGCGTNGFSAVQGWDPVTGLGSLNYGKLLNVFLDLP